MSRIKGKYIAKVEINFNFDADNKNYMLPFPEIKDKVAGDYLTNAIRDLLMFEICDEKEGEISATKEYADIYEEE